jgi:hypothetical protein
MKFFDSQWERVRLSINPTTFRIGLFVLSITALVLGGAADDTWG